MTILDYARMYLGRGFSVIPLKSKSKVAAIEWKEYQRRKPTEDELQEWFGEGSQYNIGIVTGEISGLAVVDLDSDEAVQFAKDNSFPPTPLVKTGKGYHAYYIYQDGVRNFQGRDDLPGIDLRADGGYVVAPPSLHESGIRYQWVEGKGLDDLPLAELPDIVLVHRPEQKKPLKDLYRGVHVGERNNSLARLAGSWVNDGLSVDECINMAHAWNSQNYEPLPSKEVEATVRSIFEKNHRERGNNSYASYGSYPSSEKTSGEKLFPVLPFPFEIFPQEIRDLIYRFSDAHSVEPQVFASGMLCIISGAIGNAIRISPKEGFEVPPFIWLAIVAESGYGKSPLINSLMTPVKRLQAKEYMEYKEMMEDYKRKKALSKKSDCSESLEEPYMKDYYVSDNTVEALGTVFENQPRGVLFYYDELSGLILGQDQYKSRGKGNDRQHYLELWNAGPWKIDRKNSVKFILNTGASIIGGIQPRVIGKVFGVDSFDDGLLPRFLFIRAGNEPQKFSRKGTSEHDRQFWEQILTWCYELPLNKDDEGFVDPKVLSLDDEALDIWEGFYNECEEIKPYLPERAKVFIPKIQLYSLKLAGVLHTLKGFLYGKHLSSGIHSTTVTDAIELTRFYLGQVKLILKVYDKQTDSFGWTHRKIVEVLNELKDEVRNGKLPVKRITEMFNEKVPESIKQTPQGISSLLNELGLKTKKGTGNYSQVIWEEEKIADLIHRTGVTSVTSVTLPDDERQELAPISISGTTLDDFEMTVYTSGEGFDDSLPLVEIVTIGEKKNKLSDEQRELFEELAAKFEYEGNLSREEAEKRALEEILNEKGGKND